MEQLQIEIPDVIVLVVTLYFIASTILKGVESYYAIKTIRETNRAIELEKKSNGS